MKVKRKGNMFPFLSSPSPSLSSSSYKDPDSVLKLLPVAILALALSLPNQDREVLAYLIARSIIATTANLNTTQHLKNKCKTPNNGKNKNLQKVPPFQCGCFDCYTSFWYRWDSSPNRVLIHQVIEAFEEHLLQSESPKKQSKVKKRVNKISVASVASDISVFKPKSEPQISVAEGECNVVMAPADDIDGGDMEGSDVVGEEGKMTESIDMEVVTVQVEAVVANHKGLVRKVLPDVIGLLNSRLWSLWSPGN
ncbi:hypothetical protein JCGZ_26425 [Jatropha curcas]|uniref:Uncharacterized protein n=1 Tax=Jatropha curcas TaxID=180498 RepID=A0A067JST9_JATCU|nr:uncharacterized protein LOC105648774 [Jatropha curcas]KDP22594.1 hypothetical protein JCGZ_26425 [Jatropha curcas]